MRIRQSPGKLAALRQLPSTDSQESEAIAPNSSDSRQDNSTVSSAIGAAPRSYSPHLTFLSSFPCLEIPFTRGYSIWTTNKIGKTPENNARLLKNGFFSYLMDRNLHSIQLSELDRPLLIGFVKWLNELRSSQGKTKGQNISVQYRASFLDALHCTLIGMTKTADLREEALVILEDFPRNQWPGKGGNTPRESLGREYLADLFEACMEDIAAIDSRISIADNLLSEGEKIARSTEEGFTSKADILYRLSEHFKKHTETVDSKYLEDRLTTDELKRKYKRIRYRHGPSMAAIFLQDEILFEKLITYLEREGTTLTDVCRDLYPTSDDIAPFIYLLAIETAFNTSTLLSLTWENVEIVEKFGYRFFTIGGTKRRASRDPCKDVPYSYLAGPLSTLRRLTASLREARPDDCGDALFVFSTNKLRNCAGAAYPIAAPIGDASLLQSTGRFCERHNISEFSISRIRATIGDETAARHGLFTSSRVLMHESWSTTERHYIGDGTRRRDRERLGEVQQLKERWASTNGAIDPRRVRLTPTMDKGAATPGFYCLDPYDSPRPGQKKAKLCSAYGECPDCPLAQAKIDDEFCVAYYCELRRAIFAAQGRVDPTAWTNRWAPIITALDGLLSNVTDDVLMRAHHVRCQLPPVG